MQQEIPFEVICMLKLQMVSILPLHLFVMSVSAIAANVFC